MPPAQAARNAQSSPGGFARGSGGCGFAGRVASGMAAFLHHEAEMPDPKALPATDATAAPAFPITGRPAAGTAPGFGLADQLAELRAEIDRVDDGLHDLLMRRARVVGQVAELVRVGKIPFRPGREAAIIRRLLGRHAGRLPPRAIVRLWRELFAANVSIEARLVVAACGSGPGCEMVQLAREHFGPLTPLRVFRSAAQAIAEVNAGQATVAVLPWPAEGEPEPWWPRLLPSDGQRPHVVARLPYWAAPRPEGAVTAQALVVAGVAPDASGLDRSLVGFELPARESQGQGVERLTAAGLAVLDVLAHDSASGRHLALAEVAGFVADDDPRLRTLAGAVVLGSYAVPIEMAAT